MVIVSGVECDVDGGETVDEEERMNFAAHLRPLRICSINLLSDRSDLPPHGAETAQCVAVTITHQH
jgi:hypothetical protein